jgi:Plasmid pRiA4b ORF-3-like protein
MPKKTMPKKKVEAVAVFIATCQKKIKSERRRPWRKIAIPVDDDLYSLALSIIGAFNFDADHAFGFFDNLKNPYRSEVRFELMNDGSFDFPDYLMPSDPNRISPEDQASLKALGFDKYQPKDVLEVLKVVRSVDIDEFQKTLQADIAEFVMQRLNEKLSSQMSTHLHPILEGMLQKLKQEMLEIEDMKHDYGPIETGVKDIPWSKAFLPKRTTMCFLFDYGDDWMFEVEFFGVAQANPKVKYPAILESKGTAPEQYPDFD